MRKKIILGFLLILAVAAMPGKAAAAVLSGIAISGPAQVTSGATATYTATASYNDGTTKTVVPAWSLSSTTFASIDAGGLFTALTVTADQTVTLTADYTEAGVTVNATQIVTIVLPVPAVTLTGISTSGPAQVTGGGTGTYTATAAYSDGTTKIVVPTWSLSSTTFASIDAGGVLTALTVTADQTVTVTADYTEGGITKSASQIVTIVPAAPAQTLTGISISGPAQVDGGTTATYTTTATFSDGTSKSVTPTWSLDSTTFASIETNGVLTAKTVTADQTVTVKADYTLGVVSKSATLSVKIVASSTSHLIYTDDFSKCTADGCPNWETITGAWTVKNEKLYSTKKEKSIIVVQNVPGLEQFSEGRLQAKIGLTKKCKVWMEKGMQKSAKPNAAIIFAFVDKDHYRYVTLQSGHIVIGQVGDFDGEKQGTKAIGHLPVPGYPVHALRVDIQANGDVIAYVDPPARGWRHTAITGYAFGSAATGRVGFASNKAKGWFDDFSAWDSSVLPKRPISPAQFAR